MLSRDVSQSIGVFKQRLAILSRTAVMVVLSSNDCCREERLLFLQIHFEPDSAAFAYIQQLDFLNPVGFGESYRVLNPDQLEYWWNNLVLLPQVIY